MHGHEYFFFFLVSDREKFKTEILFRKFVEKGINTFICIIKLRTFVLIILFGVEKSFEGFYITLHYILPSKLFCRLNIYLISCRVI